MTSKEELNEAYTKGLRDGFELARTEHDMRLAKIEKRYAQEAAKYRELYESCRDQNARLHQIAEARAAWPDADTKYQ